MCKQCSICVDNYSFVLKRGDPYACHASLREKRRSSHLALPRAVAHAVRAAAAAALAGAVRAGAARRRLGDQARAQLVDRRLRRPRCVARPPRRAGGSGRARREEARFACSGGRAHDNTENHTFAVVRPNPRRHGLDARWGWKRGGASALTAIGSIVLSATIGSGEIPVSGDGVDHLIVDNRER